MYSIPSGMSLEHSLCFFFGVGGSLSPEMKDLMGRSHTRLSVTKFLSLCITSCCGFLYFLFCLLQQETFLRVAEQSMIYEYSRMSLEVILLLWFFLKNSSIEFYHRSLDYLVSGSWSLSQSRIWFLLKKWTSVQIRYWLITPTSFMPQAYLAGRTVLDQRFCGWVGL